MSNKMSKILTMALLLTLVLSAASPVAFGAAADQTYYGSLGNNFYSFYGSPDIHASVQGSGEYSRGETSTIPIVLSNKGTIEGFKTENEVKDTTGNVQRQLNATLQQMEIENINGILTAVGVVATLESDVSGITVKTGPQEAGSMPTGRTSSSPLRYTVDIQKGMPAGEYELTLNVTYKHLRNVIYEADASSMDGQLTGIRNLNASYWYNENVTQKIPVTITVKEATKFEIINVDDGNLSAKNDGELYVTYKNSGEETAKNAFVRLSTATPFSTTDDQAYLGTVGPGEEKTAIFKISIDEDSVVFDKLYAINSEILYEDNYGHQVVSDAQKIEVNVVKDPFWNTTTIILLILVIIVLAVAVYYVVMSQKYKKQGIDKKPFDGLMNKISGGKNETEKVSAGNETKKLDDGKE
ncbi:hypothetical protein LJC08_04745 [Methanimicrococcus sp. OttesenSCG-928-J09]|nr:hypothetical protein [Methanimicrococcus sp. OttesenSCG-928-J09]